MALNCQMTWNTSKNQWTRMHRGQRYYVGCRTLQASYPTLFRDATKEGSYLAANAWWEAKEMDLAPRQSSSTKPRSDLIHNAKALAARQANGEEFVAVAKSTVMASEVQTIGTAIAHFLASKKLEADGKGISCERWNDLRMQLVRFQAFKGFETSLATIGGTDLIDYRNHLLGEVAASKFSSGHAAGCLVTLKQWLRWCWSTERIDTLPRNIDTLPAITVARGKIKTVKDSEWETMYKNADERMKLFILLFLNIGATQADASELRQDEVDWEAGRIIRKRTKTKDENVPTTNYKLWNETFELLKKFRSNDPVRVLVTAKGNPIKYAAIVNGKLKKTDTFASAWNRWRAKLAKSKIEIPAAKLIRKTGATKLKSNPRFAELRHYYLGHAARSIADKHYSGESDPLFDEAVVWLGQQYGIK